MIRLSRIGNKVFYEFDKEVERHAVEHALTIKHENPYFAKSYRDGHWDGLIRFYDKKNHTFPFGMITTVVTDLENAEYNYEIDGVFESPFIPSMPFKAGDKHEGTAMHQHQLEALRAFYEIKHGIIKVSTRGGKTWIASQAIEQVTFDYKDCNVLFMVESELLFDQAIDDISGFLKINKKNIGKIKGEVFDIKQITVAMIQTIHSIEIFKDRMLNKYAKKGDTQSAAETYQQLRLEKRRRNKMKKDLHAYFENVNFLIVDECHEFSNETRIATIERIEKNNCEFILFLSATPFKSEKPMDNLNLQKVSGPVIYEIHEQTLKERGILASDKILLFMFNHDNNKNINVNKDSSYGDYQSEIITNNERRNNILINVVEICRKMKLKTLVLFIYKKHAHQIQAVTGDIFLCSDDKMEVRKNTIKSFLRKKGDALFASGIFKKGLTLPEVEILINAGGGLEQSEIIQKKGRVLGVKGKKTKALIIDFIDMSKYFNEHSLSRIQVYEESVGIDHITILDTEDVDFYRDVKEFMKDWFEL